MRKVNFSNGEYYHIYNRGVDRRDVFCDQRDHTRFLKSMREFNNKETIGSLYELDYHRNKETKFPIGNLVSGLVDIVCYCINSNHYHFLLKQVSDNGIEKFMHKLGVGYSKYFNHKYDRSGSLFQGTFKAVHIDSNEYLLWLSGYVNGNIEIHKIAKAENYKWCNYQDYLGKRNGTLCNKEIILSQFRNLEEYKEFIKMTIKESEKRKDLEKYFIE